MTDDRFWTLIEMSRAADRDAAPAAPADAPGGGECYEDPQAAWLVGLLRVMSPDEIVAFGRRYHEKMDIANEAGVEFAAEWILAANDLTLSGDGWEYFRSWLVARGRIDFETVIREPDTLADLYTDIDDFLGGELVRYAAFEAYRRATGFEETPEEMSEPSPLESWPGRDLFGVTNMRPAAAAQRFPRLRAKFGDRPY